MALLAAAGMGGYAYGKSKNKDKDKAAPVAAAAPTVDDIAKERRSRRRRGTPTRKPIDQPLGVI